MPSRVTILFSVLALLASTAAAYEYDYKYDAYRHYAHVSGIEISKPGTKAGTIALFVFLGVIALPIILCCVCAFFAICKEAIKESSEYYNRVSTHFCGQTQTEEEKEKEEQLIKKSKLLL